jgi:hypothetical protein
MFFKKGTENSVPFLRKNSTRSRSTFSGFGCLDVWVVKLDGRGDEVWEG